MNGVSGFDIISLIAAWGEDIYIVYKIGITL